MIISMIVAMTPDMIIGNNGHLPWHIGSDLRRFRRITSGHHILMGRVNYEDIGRPLPGRTNLILTRDTSFMADGCITVASIEEAIRIAENAGETELFVIGGASAYRAAMPYADKLYLTIVCAKVFPARIPAHLNHFFHSLMMLSFLRFTPGRQFI